jgi:outer membrane protein OmpA-like peptidoglycan-associated protein
MFKQMMALGVGAVLTASPMIAQVGGTIEFGGFASYTKFDETYGVKNSWGAGGRVAAYVSPRIAFEFEGGGTRAGRGNGLPKVNLGVLSARLLVTPVTVGPLAVLIGGGVEHSDNYFLESYGMQALIGAKLKLGEMLALRADGIQSWASNGDGVNKSLHIGLSVYRHPKGREVMVYRTDTLRAPMMQHADSVSAEETRRLRDSDARYRSLRDSLARMPRPDAAPSVSASDVATMSQVIHFQRDKSELSDTAQRILREKVAVIRANSTMRVAIVGFASQPGSDAYNMALGMRRAEAAKAYLVSQGIAASRIEIATRGEGQLVLEGTTETANAANRRGTFRLLVADPER